MYDLVIVESPAKAKTISKYLGEGYRIEATMGHLRDLPKNEMGVSFDNGFRIEYQPIKGKETTIDALRKAANGSRYVFLATDPDREGEAISWHLKELLGLDDERARRVTFNEITKNVVAESIKHPRAIDYKLVDAQQARRVLDRLVGYKISPLLWKRIKSGLSAGRVQSVAARMVVDRENEIRAFTPDEYWSIDIDVARDSEGGGRFTVGYFAPEGKKKALLENREAVDRILEDLEHSSLEVARVGHSEKRRQPAPPFTTSTLQQEASRRLGMGAKRTMANAQALYEGVNVTGMGQTGLISYMRTDSLRLSDEAVDTARELIKNRYGEKYCPAQKRVFKTKTQAQDAHEAIRPTNAAILPEQVKNDLTNDQYRLYKIIWERFIACQMENAVYDTLTIDVRTIDRERTSIDVRTVDRERTSIDVRTVDRERTSIDVHTVDSSNERTAHIFRANYTTVVFSGFTAVYEEGRDEEEEEAGAALPDLREGEPLIRLDTKPDQHFTQPPPRYSEATLIKALEEQGIGRPSTYAPTISIILDREYVIRENNRLRPTPLGEVVNGLMVAQFNDIVDTAFTVRMEALLDKIEEGEKEWRSMVVEFNDGLSRDLEKAEAENSGRIKIPDEQSDVDCDICGRKMVIKAGRFGRFLACPGYPECKNTKPLAEEMPGVCPKCGGKILKKKSRNGYTFYGCARYPGCDFVTWDVPQKENCESCGQTMFKTGGRGVKKVFCINPACERFLPEEQRSFRKKTSEGEDKAAQTSEKGKAKTAASKKGAKAAPKNKAPSKTTAKSTAKAATKTASKSSGAAKKATTAKKPAKSKKAES